MRHASKNLYHLKLLYLFGIITFTVTFISCKSVSDSEALNEKSRKILNHYKNERLPSYEDLYKKVTLQRNSYPELTLLADSLFQSLQKIDRLLDSVSLVIEKADPTGERIDIGAKILVNTSVGIRVSEESYGTFQYSLKGLSGDEKRQIINERFSSFRYLGTPEFNEVYFSKSSSLFTLMTIKSLQNNLKKAALITFNDMHINMK